MASRRREGEAEKAVENPLISSIAFPPFPLDKQ